MLKTASKLIHNWRCYPSSKCCKIDKKRLWIGHSAVAPSDAADKNSNMGAQLQSLRCTTATKLSWKIYFSVWFLVRTNMFVPSHFWTTFTNFDTCFCCYISTCGKFLYRCTSTFRSGILLKYFCYLHKAVRPGLWKLSMNWRWIALKWVWLDWCVGLSWMRGRKVKNSKNS